LCYRSIYGVDTDKLILIFKNEHYFYMATHATPLCRAFSVNKVVLQILVFIFALHCFGLTYAGVQQLPPIPFPKSSPLSAALKQSLAAWDVEKKNEARSCAKEVAKIKAHNKHSPVEAGFDLRYEVLLDAPTVYSVAVNLNVYCGGPYPAHSETAVVFDLVTGKRYDPLKLYAIAKKGRYGVEFIPPIRAMIRQQLIQGRGVNTKDDECIQVLKNDDLQLVEDGIVAPRQKGLQIMYSGPHVVQACYGAVVLPYGELKQYLNKQEAARLRWSQ
jgi:hypothetical protein